MHRESRKKMGLFGGALIAAGIAASAQGGDFVIGETTHNHGIDTGPIVSAYAGNGDFNMNTIVGLPFGPTSIDSSFNTGTTAKVILDTQGLRGSVEKEISSFGYFAFNTYFLVSEDMDVTVSWDASTDVHWIDRRFRVWQSMGPTLFEYDPQNGPHSGTTTITLLAGQVYWADALYRTTGENGVGSFSMTQAAACLVDLNGDGQLDFFDVSAFLTAYSSQDPAVDFNNDGNFDFFDVSTFLSEYNAGCP